MRYWLPRVLWALLALWFLDAMAVLAAAGVGMIQVPLTGPPIWLELWVLWGVAFPMAPAALIALGYALVLLWKNLPRKETHS